MDIMAEKIELIKQLLATDDIGLIKAIKSILKPSVQKHQDWGNLPDEVIIDIKDVLQEIHNRTRINHLEARERTRNGFRD